MNKDGNVILASDDQEFEELVVVHDGICLPIL